MTLQAEAGALEVGRLMVEPVEHLKAEGVEILHRPLHLKVTTVEAVSRRPAHRTAQAAAVQVQ